MKKIRNHFIVGIALLFCFTTLIGQDFNGKWNGMLKLQATQLRLVFHVTQNEEGYSATMDSPDQFANGIPITKTTVENNTIKFELTAAGIVYQGEWKDGEIIGTFSQSGMDFPLNLSRKEIIKVEKKRPQEPIPPFSYHSEEVTFQNAKAEISLAGTLTLPNKEGIFPAVILISGSGPQNRNEELMGHKPFLVISDFLTKNGIAVLRYDDRGVGDSQGDFDSATSADFATDVESAIAYLKTRKEIDTDKIGLIGHSEGGLIAPMVASTSDEVDFIILMAGTGIRGDQLLLAQQELIARANGISETEIKKSVQNNAQLFEIVLQMEDMNLLNQKLTEQMDKIISEEERVYLPEGVTKESFIQKQIEQLTNPWMYYFLRYDPTEALEKVTCPVLALNGEKDLQVPPKENLTAIKSALESGGNTNVTIKEFPNLNHLFQESTTGSPSEYADIDQTISPIVLQEMLTWIKAQ